MVVHITISINDPYWMTALAVHSVGPILGRLRVGLPTPVRAIRLSIMYGSVQKTTDAYLEEYHKLGRKAKSWNTGTIAGYTIMF